MTFVRGPYECYAVTDKRHVLRLWVAPPKGAEEIHRTWQDLQQSVHLATNRDQWGNFPPRSLVCRLSMPWTDWIELDLEVGQWAGWRESDFHRLDTNDLWGADLMAACCMSYFHDGLWIGRVLNPARDP